MTQAKKLEALLRRADRLPVPINRFLAFKKLTVRPWIEGTQVIGHDSDLEADIKSGDNHSMYLFNIIFNHDFARALFGDEFKPYTIVWYRLDGQHMKDPDDFVAQHRYIKAWELHIQQAVISKDPIDYTYKEVFGE